MHLSIGQEASATGVCAVLDKGDYITSTHRGHGHCIAKGCDVKGMMKEIYGRRDGLCKGKAGSMHIVFARPPLSETGGGGGTHYSEGLIPALRALPLRCPAGSGGSGQRLTWAWIPRPMRRSTPPGRSAGH